MHCFAKAYEPILQNSVIKKKQTFSKNRPEYPSNQTSKKFDHGKEEQQMSNPCIVHSMQICCRRNEA